MKRILAGVALIGTAVSAQAADLATKAPYYKAPIVQVYDWTGFYVGVNAGVGLGRDRAIHDIAPGLTNTSYLQPFGALGGGQIGYNYQTNSLFGPLVIGLEGDFQGADLSDNRTSVLGGAVSYSQKLDWFATARGRIGIARGPVLNYFTGGFAAGDVRTTVTEGFTAFDSGKRTLTGWTIGSGVEAALGGNWTGKIEYLYLDLGNKTDSFLGQTLQTNVRENIFRVGLNYRIGGNGLYAPAPVANWTGFYLGGNFGSASARNRSTAGVGPFSEQFNLALDGFVGGGQVGYNWQASNWVYGLEADFQGSTQRDNDTAVFGGLVAYDAKLPWFGTVRGRLGYSVGSTLFYGTGGYAYGNVKTTIVSPFGSESISKTASGWTAGAGIETPFTLLGLVGPNWTSKTEYLYLDLGSTSSDFAAGTFPNTTKVTEHIFRTGINYHFNSPVVAKY
ncbi:outer membrane protein [Rhodopseudomonas rhenobacensis]|uniref:outer membrane protein n=1 Tax=Rhodopseudomonas rhenobacensis TaxID=87461 RepID=UPI00160E3E86|nr:outer membrane beta-barrel protein [Rhodopseudomonas rhenobacensis]